MHSSPVRIALFAMICLLMPALGKAEGFPMGLTRYEIGYNYALTSSTLAVHYRDFNSNTQTLTDTSYKEHIRTKGGFGVTVGTYFPVAQMGESGRMAISIAYMYNALIWETDGAYYDNTTNNGGGVTVTSNGNVVSSATIEMGLPVGLDYKFGCDATCDKSKRYCFTVGAGGYPQLALTAFRGVGSANFRLLPYLKAELGVFAGICMKVRATYSFGNIKYFKVEDHDGTFSGEASLTGKSALSLSVIFMPMSWKWNKVSWWR